MESSYTIKINFRGGIISPGDLYNILSAVSEVNIDYVSFGLRQQLLIETEAENYSTLIEQLRSLHVNFEVNGDAYPNIVSSYPAEEIFITKTWLSEGVYKDIFDLIDYEPRLKINVSDSNQSFTPMLTGNINWVASFQAQHFWHLFIRFPKTNTIYEWNQLVYTNDVARISKCIEKLILENAELFYDNPHADGHQLFNMVEQQNYITKTAETPAQLPAFNLPYYEGLNRYNDKYWLGIYRRDEMFGVDFLKDLCNVCLQTKAGQICSTPWKSLIIKGIDEKNRESWNNLLAKHQVNVRHAANELNFQVEDNCKEGVDLKSFLVKHLSKADTRTFGICFGIKTRKKSEVFSSILIRKKPLLSIGGIELFSVYDILCANDFNPNERTGFVFSRNNPKFLLPEQLRRSVIAFYKHRTKSTKLFLPPEKKELEPKKSVYAYQCINCLTVYEPQTGSPEQNISPGTAFENLPPAFCCPLCEAPSRDFKVVDQSTLLCQLT